MNTATMTAPIRNHAPAKAAKPSHGFFTMAAEALIWLTFVLGLINLIAAGIEIASGKLQLAPMILIMSGAGLMITAIFAGVLTDISKKLSK